MFVSEDLQVNAQGHLTIGGQDTVELAKQYGTPLYVMDEDLIRKHCRSFKQSMDKFYQGKGLVCYASKAFSCKAIYRVMQEEGLGVDVVSGGELYTAMQTGFDSSKICFHGNNKTTEELQMAPVISFETAVSWQQLLLFLLLAVTANCLWNALHSAAAAANPAVLEMSSVLLPVIGFSVMAVH